MLSSILMVLVFVILVGCLFFTRKKGSSPTSLIGRRLPTSPTKKHSKPKNWRPYPAIVSKYKLLQYDNNHAVCAEFCLPDMDNLPAGKYCNITASDGVAEGGNCIQNFRLKPSLDQLGQDMAEFLPKTRALVIFKGKDGAVYVRPGDECRKNPSFCAYIGSGHNRKEFIHRLPLEELAESEQILSVGCVFFQFSRNQHGQTFICEGNESEQTNHKQPDDDLFED